MEVITLKVFKEHARIDFDDDDEIVWQVVAAANAYVSGLVYADVEELPAEAPADVIQAALLIASHWYENRETALAGALSDIPLNATEILANHRAWSFG
ncbi:head-tail connector protein [Roseixanthobacter pseudopolyaromaticivorans]|uniref:head-tail connector protein n=1 Tax=Xanthobacteraceae TaxID=335928 RepID=UPI00372A5B1B